jgi:hypothetical protein
MKTIKKFERQDFVDALCIRFGGYVEDSSIESPIIAERPITEICRMFLHNEGYQVPIDNFEMIRTATIFGDVLTDALTKTLLSFYTSAQVTWQRWANSTNLANLSGERVVVNPVETPGEVGPGQKFPESHQEGTKEKILLAKYGQLLDVPFEVILNDDITLIGRLLREHAQACNRLENYICYQVLQTPGTIDGKAFFHVDYGNLLTNNALTAGHLSIAMAQIRNMKMNNVALRLTPAVLLIPPALEQTARELVTGLYNRDTDPDRLDVVAESCLDFSATTWYLAADKNQTDSLVMGFLEGELKPRIDPVRAFNFDGRRYRIKHICGCKAVRPAGIVKNTA